jgi:hypothetical protein
MPRISRRALIASLLVAATIEIPVQAIAAGNATEEIRAPGGRLLGRMVTQSTGRVEARDPGGRLLGTYDPKSNETRDPGGRLLSRSNTLA